MAVFQAVLNRNRLAGYSIGLGAILAEAIYAGIPLFGVGSLNKDHVIFDVMYIAFIPILFFLGILTIRNRRKGLEEKPTEVETANTDKASIGEPKKARGYFGLVAYGFLLCGSNPMTFFFWVQATVLLQKGEWISDDFPTIMAFYLGVPLGTFILYASFAQLAFFTRRRINDWLRIKLNVFVGGVFLFLSVYLLLTYLEKKAIYDFPFVASA